MSSSWDVITSRPVVTIIQIAMMLAISEPKME
jgi:hypothetical protein